MTQRQTKFSWPGIFISMSAILFFIKQCRREHNWLGITLQLTTARFPGIIQTASLQIPSGVQFYVALQLNIHHP
nr:MULTISPECIES: DUF4158 domain-containing protein [Enterobacterales]